MTVLDAYAVLAFLKGEAAAAEVHLLFAGGDAVVTSVGAAEVVDHLVRIAGADEEEALLDVAQLDLRAMVPVDDVVGLAAGRLRARRYHRTACAVSMADCVAAEAARAAGRPLATSDPHLLDVCHAEGIAVHPLPASDGTRWAPPGRPDTAG